MDSEQASACGHRLDCASWIEKYVLERIIPMDSDKISAYFGACPPPPSRSLVKWA